jgi:F-box and leucine-rich repeat protein 1 (S-phase kinase-associated protein 2)
MSKRQKLSFVELDDMPEEIILKIFTFLDIREILKCGQVSQRIRAISNDESLWLQLNFFEGHVPYGLLEKAVENGCKYLGLASACLYDGGNSNMPLNLKYLEMSYLRSNNDNFYETHEGLLKNCHSLQKLAMKNLVLDSEAIKHIGKNGETLEVLNLADIHLSTLYPNPNRAKSIEKLFKRCVELIELNFSTKGFYESELFTAIAYNLTPKIMKVDLSNNKNLKDRHVETIIKRCNKITELKLSFTSITKKSVDSIVTHLNSSLEKLDVFYTEIDSTALLQLRSVGTLNVLNCFDKINGMKGQEEYLRKNLPQVSINEESYSIATSTSDTVLFPDYEFWEIKAKAQKL